ncbi:glycosyltransferase family 2 protein [Olivibacter sp. SA151]|uniref:glycosyltransferase n=1 Tax=Olivibacter jilunii TaxID=985016 RepID=UPI003F141E7C
MNIDYSIVICSYNPDSRLLSRCLNAVSQLKKGATEHEVILVDNNSAPRLEELDIVSEHAKRITNFNIIREEQPGLLHARVAGIKHARGHFIVFFDDDNEPEHTYLEQLTILEQQYPHVGAWGPGKVQVRFIDDIDTSFKSIAEELFQKRDEKFIAYACQRRWQPCYPFGTGLCIKKRHAEKYVELIGSRQLTLTGRFGTTLSSGDDTQLVLCTILNNEAAGIAPNLKIGHIIPKKRTSVTYLKNLMVGTRICYDVSIKQIFAEHPIYSGKKIPSDNYIRFKVLKKILKAKLTHSFEKKLKVIEDLAMIAGAYIAEGRPAPFDMNEVIKKI